MRAGADSLGMRCAALVFACLSVLGCQPALAANPWLCSLSQDLTRLVCLTEPDPLDEAPSADRDAITAVVKGTRFPLDPRQTYTVNFWAPDMELERAEQLAMATICYRSPGCEVIFTAAALWRSTGESVRSSLPRRRLAAAPAAAAVP